MAVDVSPELFASRADGVQICYQTFGDPSDEPLLLVMGLAGPMTWWDPGLCTRLAEAGFFVIRYDNRDVGRSSHLTGAVTLPKLAAAFFGARVRAPYTLVDMAEDGLAVLDALGIDSANVCGISMGGMIAQTLAVTHPDRVRSLTSIMSTTGRRTVGWQHPSVMPTLLSKGGGKDAYVKSSVATWKLIGSPAYPETEDAVRRRAAETYDRGVTAAGVARQMLAVITQPNRTKTLGRVTVPTTVIHGLADKMVHVSGGRATSMAVPGSELILIDGMGHDLPADLWETYVAAIRRTADRAAAATA
jgi:pimeloyl-ACP methyl ester carboxylesterase